MGAANVRPKDRLARRVWDLLRPSHIWRFGQALTDGFTASPSFISNDSYSPALLLDTGIPSYPKPPNLDPAQDNGGSGGGFGGITYVSPKYGRPGMVQNWSLELNIRSRQI
ncbi:MAG: hypothetical protein NVS1B11_01900 [Terriglobales bacterium]